MYAHHLLLILISTIKSKVKAGKGFQEDLEKYLDNGFVARLLGMFVLPTLKEEAGEEEVAKDPRLLLDAGKVLGLILQRVGNEYVKFSSRVIYMRRLTFSDLIIQTSSNFLEDCRRGIPTRECTTFTLDFLFNKLGSLLGE